MIDLAMAGVMAGVLGLCLWLAWKLPDDPDDTPW